MSVQVFCDVCERTSDGIWGTFTYSPGGGRLGSADFHFCFKCVSRIRAFVTSEVVGKATPRSRIPDGSIRTALFDDAREFNDELEALLAATLDNGAEHSPSAERTKDGRSGGGR